jgi:hypothetical protein
LHTRSNKFELYAIAAAAVLQHQKSLLSGPKVRRYRSTDLDLLKGACVGLAEFEFLDHLVKSIADDLAFFQLLPHKNNRGKGSCRKRNSMKWCWCVYDCL